MRIESIQIENYKGFDKSDVIEFGRGFNVLVGQNNSGKSALLETFRLHSARSVPHRSVEFEVGARLPPHSVITATYSLSGQELRHAIITNGGAALPIPSASTGDVEGFLALLFSQEQIKVSFSAVGGGAISQIAYPSYHSENIPDFDPNMFYTAKLANRDDLQGFTPPSLVRSGEDNIFAIVEAAALTSTYVFSAQRLNVGQFPASEQKILDPSANNLPAVLHYLSTNPSRYERFCSHVSEILPNVKWVSVVTVNNSFEIRVWPIDKETERDDLALSLMEGGTGVGQILAILFVAMTMSNAIIAIDEPNNFLHPGAVKKLIGILSSYSTNQYIISTHSTDAILQSDPSTIHMVKWEEGRSNVHQINTKSASELKQLLNEIGTTLSDVFGPDSIVWVEGETEQFCFPEICRRYLGGTPPGLAFLPLRSTSDVEIGNRNAEKALGLYDRISSLGAIIPPALAFSFDRELRSAKDIEDLERRQLRTLVLRRRTVENYFVVPAAIANVISEESGVTVASSDLDQWISDNKGNYFPHDRLMWTSDTWENYVDAPNLIKDAFSYFTDAKLEFRKTRHSIMLLVWIQQNEPDKLKELADYVEALIAS